MAKGTKSQPNLFEKKSYMKTAQTSAHHLGETATMNVKTPSKGNTIKHTYLTESHSPKVNFGQGGNQTFGRSPPPRKITFPSSRKRLQESDALRQSKMTELLKDPSKPDDTKREANQNRTMPNYTSMMAVQEAQLTKPFKQNSFLSNIPNVPEQM